MAGDPTTTPSSPEEGPASATRYSPVLIGCLAVGLLALGTAACSLSFLLSAFTRDGLSGRAAPARGLTDGLTAFGVVVILLGCLVLVASLLAQAVAARRRAARRADGVE